MGRLYEIPNSEQPIYLDTFLKGTLDYIIEAVTQKNFDYISIIDGFPGTGKSTLAFNLASYVDPTFRGDDALKRTCIMPEEIKDAVLKAEKFQAIVIDEAIIGFAGRRVMTKLNNVLFSMLEQIRQKNLFIFLCIPSWYNLDSSLALSRANSLFHVYLQKGKLRRGNFIYFDRSRKHRLWFNGGKRFQIYRVKGAKANFRGNFTRFYPFEFMDYEKKKLKSLQSYISEMNKEKTKKPEVKKGLSNLEKLKIQQINTLKHLKELGYTHNEIGKVAKIGTREVSRLVNQAIVTSQPPL